MSVKGKPAIIPLSLASITPFFTAGINSLGMAPPLISSTNSNPSPRFLGSTLTKT